MQPRHGQLSVNCQEAGGRSGSGIVSAVSSIDRARIPGTLQVNRSQLSSIWLRNHGHLPLGILPRGGGPRSITSARVISPRSIAAICDTPIAFMTGHFRRKIKRQ